MLLFLGILLNQLGAPAATHCLTKMKLDLEKDCNWTVKMEQPTNDTMPEHPSLELGRIPGCFRYCYETRLTRSNSFPILSWCRHAISECNPFVGSLASLRRPLISMRTCRIR